MKLELSINQFASIKVNKNRSANMTDFIRNVVNKRFTKKIIAFRILFKVNFFFEIIPFDNGKNDVCRHVSQQLVAIKQTLIEN